MVSRGKIFSKDQKTKRKKREKNRGKGHGKHTCMTAKLRIADCHPHVTYIVWYGYNTPFILPR